ncbi:MobA/MobL family protein [Ochrobactrum daejeonense]|nr:MobA/MobL family protein [Brucella daejeonensis]
MCSHGDISSSCEGSSRATGQSAVAAASYRHCAAMTNQTYERSYDFSNKRGNVHSEFAIPANAPDWARSLANLSPVQASEAFGIKLRHPRTGKTRSLLAK